MKKIILMTVVSFLSLTFLAFDKSVFAQDRRITGGNHLGCTDHEYLSKTLSYSFRGDSEAFRKAAATGIMAGVCTLFDNGQAVYLTGTRIRSGFLKVRKPGEIKEYYIQLEAVSK